MLRDSGSGRSETATVNLNRKMNPRFWKEV